MNSESTLLWTFEIPYIQWITEEALRWIEARRRWVWMLLELDQNDIMILRALSKFDNLSIYMIRRMRELIWGYIAKIISERDWEISVTRIRQDIKLGVDIRIREREIQGRKKRLLRYADITESYQFYQEKKNGKSALMDGSYIIHISHTLLDYCYNWLLKLDEDMTLEEKIKYLCSEFSKITGEVHRKTINIYDPVREEEIHYILK